MGQAHRALCTNRQQIREPLRECLLRTGCDSTKEAADLEAQTHLLVADRQIARPTRVGAVDTPRGAGALRAACDITGRMRLNEQRGRQGLHAINGETGEFE